MWMVARVPTHFIPLGSTAKEGTGQRVGRVTKWLYRMIAEGTYLIEMSA